eukprot:361454-Chlamydomonas_euryale.AAC.3
MAKHTAAAGGAPSRRQAEAPSPAVQCMLTTTGRVWASVGITQGFHIAVRIATVSSALESAGQSIIEAKEARERWPMRRASVVAELADKHAALAAAEGAWRRRAWACV